MSKELSEKLTAGSHLEDVNSVYDFLYYDSQRIGSFLGQFDPDGLLQSRKRIAGMGRSSQDKANHMIKGGVPAVVGAQGSYENQTGERYDKSAEHTYDPLWANALQFLEYLDVKNLISRHIISSRLGQFVLTKGSLLINDMSLLKAMVENTTLKSGWPLGWTTRSRQVRGKQKPNPRQRQSLYYRSFQYCRTLFRLRSHREKPIHGLL